MSDETYRCPACGSGRVSREIISAASKGKTNWDAPLNQWAGDRDVCDDCGNKWKPSGVVFLPGERVKRSHK